MNINKRQPEESNEHYRFRMREWNKNLKIYLRGTLVWDSTKRGPYIKKLHGEL